MAGAQPFNGNCEACPSRLDFVIINRHSHSFQTLRTTGSKMCTHRQQQHLNRKLTVTNSKKSNTKLVWHYFTVLKTFFNLFLTRGEKRYLLRFELRKSFLSYQMQIFITFRVFNNSTNVFW